MKKTLTFSMVALIVVSMLVVLPHRANTQATAEQLTTNSYRDSHPSWSPDGAKIVWNAFSDSWHRNIWIMNSDGTGKAQLTSGNRVDSSPVFSPDGTKIAFDRWGIRGDYCDLMIMNSDGTGIQRITFGGIPGLTEGTYEVAQWSKDGLTLIFGYGEGTTGVYKPWWVGSIRTDGSDLKSLGVRGLNPRFCYDDTKIIFNTDPFLGDMRIAIINEDGTGQEYLTDGPTDWGPDMSAYSHRIVFTRGDPGDLYLMNANGSNMTRLTSDGESHESSWSPDEEYIAYTSGVGANYDIWKIEAPIPPDTYVPYWHEWWFWAIIGLCITNVASGSFAIKYRHITKSMNKSIVSKKTKPTMEIRYKICSNCGAQLPEHSEFCGKCGTKLE